MTNLRPISDPKMQAAADFAAAMLCDAGIAFIPKVPLTALFPLPDAATPTGVGAPAAETTPTARRSATSYMRKGGAA